MNIELCRKFFSSLTQGKVFVGFSGGADSTAALLIAHHFQQYFHYELTAVHFDHHLRGVESDADAAWCRNFSAKHHIAFEKIDISVSAGSGMEAAARQERLNWWIKLAGNDKKCAVVLGHHCDDRIENFLLRFLRGSNLSGLIAPKGKSLIEGVCFLRPLLAFSRDEIEQFLRSRNVCDWRIDSTNKIADCARNSIRLEVLPRLYALFSGAHDGAEVCLETLEQDADFIEQAARQVFDIQKTASRSYWKDLHPALLPRVIRLWKNEIPSRDFIMRLQDELQRSEPSELRSVPWSETECLCFHYDRIFWKTPDTATNTNTAVWDLALKKFIWGNWIFFQEETEEYEVKSKYEAIFDAETLGRELVVTLPCPGDRMSLFGSARTEKIKILRVNSKIPTYFQLPVIKNMQGEIVWAPGIRHSATAAVNKNTRKAVRLRAESLEFGIRDRIN